MSPKSILVCNPLSEDSISMLRSVTETDIVVKPFIRTESIPFTEWENQVPSENQSWVFTSKKAVAAVSEAREYLPAPNAIFCVGPKTRALLWKTQVPVFIPEAFNKEALSRQLAESGYDTFIHFKGSLSDDTISDTLTAEGKIMNNVVVYTTYEIKQKVKTDHYDGIVFMSPSAVESYRKHNTAGSIANIYCIGPSTADAARKSGFKGVQIPEDATLESLANLIKHTL